MLVNYGVTAQRAALYSDGRDSKVLFPLGAMSFADEVISFNYGSPFAEEDYRTYKGILNIPDYDLNVSSSTTTLGCGGEIVLAFKNNVLIDVEGPDLFVFETGPALEATQIYISTDSKTWIDVGILKGGKSDIDISGKVNKSDVFRYVKLIDLKEDCKGKFPGADIDAVGAIGSSMRISMNSSVMFDTGKYELKDTSELEHFASILKNLNASFIVEGHTDNAGSEENNKKLSLNRAKAVKAFLISEGLPSEKISANGYGELNPIATNETEEGKQLNRRVEIIVKSGNVVNYNQDFAGTWTTTNGTLHLYEVGEDILGWYNLDDGELYTWLTGSRTMEGRWVEANSSTSCEGNYMGSNAWGKISITFNDDFTEFDAKWSYCDDEPSQGNWSGTK